MKYLCALVCVAATALLGSGCASGGPSSLALVNSGWTPLPVTTVPSLERYQWDRESFLGFVNAAHGQRTEGVRRDGRSATWLRFAAAGFAAMGIAEFRNASSGRASDVSPADAIAIFGVWSGGFFLWGRHRKSDADRRLQCMTDAQEMSAAFRSTWPHDRAPSSLAEWSEYRGHQDRIVAVLTCP